MVPSSNQSGSIFTQSFINKIHPFSTVRFMDALNTNGNLIKNWSQRSWPTAGSRAGTAGGIAYEDIIALANLTGKDVWINIPVLATDDYVCRLARLFRYGESGSNDNGSNCSTTAASAAPTGAVALNATSHVYVEFSNEVWNWGFQQVSDIYCMANGAPASYSCSTGTCYHACDVTAPTSILAQQALVNPAYSWTKGYAMETQMSVFLTKRDNDIFKTVFGSHSSQVRTVMNVQSAYALEVDSGFQMFQNAKPSVPVSSFVDVMAVAPYFNASSTTYESSLDSLFGDLANVLLQKDPDAGGLSIYAWLQGDLAEANKYGLPVVAYEGGQSLTDGYSADTTAQTDPRMFTEYQKYFALWDQVIGRSHLFSHFELAGDGSWGALRNSEDPGSQKFDAMLSMMLTPGDANEDGVVNQADCAILRANYGKSGMFWTQGDFNHDGVVNATDLALMNQHIIGSPCTAP
jgi:Dockerin type I domain